MSRPGSAGHEELCKKRLRLDWNSHVDLKVLNYSKAVAVTTRQMRGFIALRFRQCRHMSLASSVVTDWSPRTGCKVERVVDLIMISLDPGLQSISSESSRSTRASDQPSSLLQLVYFDYRSRFPSG